MKDYLNFTVEDFILDEDFIRWVMEKKPGDNSFWDQWISLHPEQRPLIMEARRVIESMEIEQHAVSRKEIQLETEKLLQTIAPTLDQAVSKRPASFFSMRYRKWVAAAALLLIIAGVALFRTWKKEPHSKAFEYATLVRSRHLKEHINTTPKPDTLLLPDSSLVIIESNSRISYTNNFDSSAGRDYYLSGEASFKVKKHPGIPFRVFAGEVVTRVLGTSFTVRSYEKDSIIQVIVHTGKVSVSVQSAPPVAQGSRNSKAQTPATGGIILTCNQRLIYEKEGQKFQKDLLDHPAMIVPDLSDSNSAYEDAPLEEVFTQLRKAYGINIVYDSELLRKCTVTADLRGESFYRRLDLICRAIGARYEVIDGQVVIQSGGCQ